MNFFFIVALKSEWNLRRDKQSGCSLCFPAVFRVHSVATAAQSRFHTCWVAVWPLTSFLSLAALAPVMGLEGKKRLIGWGGRGQSSPGAEQEVYWDTGASLGAAVEMLPPAFRLLEWHQRNIVLKKINGDLNKAMGTVTSLCPQRPLCHAATLWVFGSIHHTTAMTSFMLIELDLDPEEIIMIIINQNNFFFNVPLKRKRQAKRSPFEMNSLNGQFNWFIVWFGAIKKKRTKLAWMFWKRKDWRWCFPPLLAFAPPGNTKHTQSCNIQSH